MALQLATPFLPKSVSNLLQSSNALKRLEIELEYAKRNFERFEIIVTNIRKFAAVWQYKLCALDEAEFFLQEWKKQLPRFETDINKSVFNTVMDASVRAVNADKFRKNLAEFKYEMQTVQLNAVFELLALMVQLNTASLAPDPQAIIASILQTYSEPCERTEQPERAGKAPYQPPRDWATVTQKLTDTAKSLYPTGPSPKKSFLPTETMAQLNSVIS